MLLLEQVNIYYIEKTKATMAVAMAAAMAAAMTNFPVLLWPFSDREEGLLHGCTHKPRAMAPGQTCLFGLSSPQGLRLGSQDLRSWPTGTQAGGCP